MFDQFDAAQNDIMSRNLQLMTEGRLGFFECAAGQRRQLYRSGHDHNHAATGQRPGFVEVRVADTGKSIDPAVRPRLFEKFVTKSEGAKGTGLGLYLCKAIVEANGGKIWAEDRKGKGAVFAFTLPAKAQCAFQL